MELKNIGENVRRLRLEKGLTQAQLAEIADISTVHMSHIETGSVAMSLECLIRISDGLDTTPDSILLGEYKISTAGAGAMITDYMKNLTSDENRLIIEVTKLLNELQINKA